MGAPLTQADASALESCLASGGIAIFPADTVYGLACDPTDATAVERLYALKDRSRRQAAAVMYWDLNFCLAGLSPLSERMRTVLRALLPGPATLVVPNLGYRFPLACGHSPKALGVRVPQVTLSNSALTAIKVPILQSSANFSGQPAAARIVDISEPIRAAADLVLDAGELPGTASTVVDLTSFERDGSYRVLRVGALHEPTIKQRLATL